MHHEAISSSVYPVSNGCGMSVLVGTGDNIWSGLYVISSTLGFIILVALLNIFYVNRFSIDTWWYKGLLFVVCMVAGALLFGGSVIGLWHLWGRQNSERDEYKDDGIEVDRSQNVETVAPKDIEPANPNSSTVFVYGSRPDFEGIFPLSVLFFSTKP